MILLPFLLSNQWLKAKTSAKEVKTSHKKPFTGRGDVRSFMVGYNRWAEDYKKGGGDQYLVLPLTWFERLSSERTDAYGQVIINLQDKTVKAEIKGLAGKGDWELWFVHNRPGQGRSIRPETGDDMAYVGKFAHEYSAEAVKSNGIANLTAATTIDVVSNFQLDNVVVTRAGQFPGDGFVLWGTPTLYQRLYLSDLRGQFGVLRNDEQRAAIDKTKNVSWPVAFFNWLAGTPAQAQVAPDGIAALDDMIAMGHDLFVNETFEGNGRTCNTCHRENANFTITPQFIAQLPSTDPIFVAETNPALSMNFEMPMILRNYALFIENVDGTDDLAHKFTLRSASHTFALSTSIIAPPVKNGVNVVDFTTVPPNQRMGWGGDGAPGNGTLREFAIGAVMQHFTKSLNRMAGTDFRLPTDDELDALEAFQLSLGRQEDFDFDVLKLKSSLPTMGQQIYADDKVGKCNVCHFNGGAAAGFAFKLNGLPPNINGSFEIGVDLARAPGMPDLPPDGGFGRVLRSDGAYGDLRAKQFSTPPLVEAADTPPFFHNNTFNTIEDAVHFYSSKIFNKSFSGKFDLPPLKGGIHLKKKQEKAISALLRVMNVLENIRRSIALAQTAQQSDDMNSAQLSLNMTLGDNQNAITDLMEGVGPSITDASMVISDLNMASNLATSAGAVSDKTMRDQMIDQAISQLKAARDLLVDPTTLPKSYQQ
jgi:cytochrome c peroxidase